MWRVLKGKIFKKKDGSIDTVTVSLVAILVMSVVFIFFISSIVPIKKSTDVESIARKYMFKIEQNGYLTPDSEAAMMNDLSSLGISNVDITGTTLSQVNYGDDVDLCITYKYPVKTIVMGSGIIPSLQYVDKTISIKKSSTSKKANY